MKYFERFPTELTIMAGKCVPTDDCQYKVQIQCTKCVGKWDPAEGVPGTGNA